MYDVFEPQELQVFVHIIWYTYLIMNTKKSV